MTDLNQLRAACEHGKWERHATYVATDGSEKFIPWHVAAEITDGSVGECPGGRVLNQAIIIERDTDGALSPPWVREWRCWREDGSYYGACDEQKIAAWKELPKGGWSHRHMDCGWQIYAMEDALASAQETR